MKNVLVNLYPRHCRLRIRTIHSHTQFPCLIQITHHTLSYLEDSPLYFSSDFEEYPYQSPRLLETPSAKGFILSGIYNPLSMKQRMQWFGSRFLDHNLQHHVVIWFNPTSSIEENPIWDNQFFKSTYYQNVLNTANPIFHYLKYLLTATIYLLHWKTVAVV